MRQAVSLRIMAGPAVDSTPAAVSQHRAGGDRSPELRGLFELVRLERETQVAVDLVESHSPKNGSRWLARRER